MKETVTKLGTSAEEAGRIVIEPVREKAYDLDDLLRGITAKNRHEAADFGPAAGKEIW